MNFLFFESRTRISNSYIYTMKIHLLFIIVVLITSCSGQVQTNPFTNTGNEFKINHAPEEKLLKPPGIGAGANIHCAIRDKAGKLWFGTTGAGVYMYDGKVFVNFTEKDGLSSNFVWCISEDTSGTLWFGTGDGACKYDGKTFSPVPVSVIRNENSYSPDPSNKAKTDSYGNPLEENAVWDIFQDREGVLWFGTNDGAYRYTGGSFNRFPDNDPNSLKIKKVERILEDKAGTLWLGGRMNEGVFCYNGKTLTNLKPDG